MASTARVDPPAWLTPLRPTTAERLQIARSWNGDSDSRFEVSIPELRALISDGYQATPTFYFRIISSQGVETGFSAWCRKLGLDLHMRIAEQLDDDAAAELETYARDVGNVNNWAAGFTSLFKYLDEVKQRTGIDVDALRVIGRPGKPLLAAALGTSSEADVRDESAEHTIEDSARRVHELLQEEKNVIVEGVAGSGKSHLLHALRPLYAHVEVVVFHPSTSYEEFVSGLRPTADNRFEGVAGVFVRACDRAAAQPDLEHLIFIDEINRANTPRVFGDLLLPLEKGKRARSASLGGRALHLTAPSGALGVTLQTPVGVDQRAVLVVPDNLHVLGTMNSTDRSVGTIDLALRRRFSWLSMEPMTTATLLSTPVLAAKIGGASDATRGDWLQVVEWYGQTNEALLNEIGPDARLGHAYVLGASSPRAAAQGLMAQLAEIAFTFNLAAERLEEIPAVELPGAQISLNAIYRGQGLGRRPSVLTQRLSAVPEDGSEG